MKTSELGFIRKKDNGIWLRIAREIAVITNYGIKTYDPFMVIDWFPKSWDELEEEWEFSDDKTNWKPIVRTEFTYGTE